ncbi:MAG: conjugal transfer protein TraX [Bacilli bacterium]|jgi:hypothetical protein|nr:conjugal transfer protein TraX [Bacilli bacterium]
MKIINLNAFYLKLIALITMTIDHIGYFIFPDITILRIIGRLSFVIFAYMIGNGYLYTSNKIKHGLIILLFGILIDIVLLLTNNYINSNIFVTLGLGYFLIMAYDKKKYLICLLILLLVLFLPLDYGLYGLLIILFSYIFHNDISKLLITNFILVVINIYFGIMINIQLFSCLGIILLYFYNNEKGYNLKYFFYVYYPLHILVIRLFVN